MLSIKHNIDISQFPKLIPFLIRKLKILIREQVKQFLSGAYD